MSQSGDILRNMSEINENILWQHSKAWQRKHAALLYNCVWPQKATRSGNQFRCALIFHYHACLHTHIYAGSSHRLVTRRHDWKYWLCGKSELVNVGLMNTGQNHFRPSQQRINTIIVINGDVMFFSSEIIIALSCLLCPLPLQSPIFSAILAPSHSFPTLLLCAVLPLWPHFLFSKPVHHFFFSPLIV